MMPSCLERAPLCALLLLGALSLSACELFTELSDPPTQGARQVSRLVITPAQPSLKVGAELALTAQALDRDDSPISDALITWTSLAPALVTVDAQGRLRGVSPGQGVVEATSAGVRAQVNVEVFEDNEVGVTEVRLLPDALTLSVGQSRQLQVTVLNMEGPVEQPTVAWRSSAPEVVSVSPSGVIRGLVVGQSTITATSGGKSAVARILVEDAAAGGFKTVAVGQGHACAADGRGVATCWGQGAQQQWGVPYAEAGVTQLHTVAGQQRFKQLVAGAAHTCGVDLQGDVYCWGAGRLGGPVKLKTSLSFDVLSAYGDTTCGIDRSKKAHCWGAQEETPKAVATAYEFEQIAVGRAHVCGLVGTEAYCWGEGALGQTGQDGLMDSDEPRLVRSESGGRFDLRVLAAGDDVTCGVTISGQPHCWGSGLSGRLGRAQPEPSARPLLIPGGHSFERLAVADRHVCGVKQDGQVWCWGDNRSGVFAKRPLTLSALPSRIGGNLLFEQVQAHGAFMCGVTRDERLFCWGERGANALGDGRLGFTQAPTPSQEDASALDVVSVGWRHTCAVLKGMGQALCVGRGQEGQLGRGDTEDFVGRVLNAPLGLGLRDIAAGHTHACDVSQTGQLRCWGDNARGQLGSGNRFQAFNAQPVSVQGDPSFVSVVVSRSHSCALDDQQQLYCWGADDMGQVSGARPSMPQDVLRPTLVSGLGQGVKQVSAGDDRTCAILADDSARCWGQPGPISVPDNLSTVKSISAGPGYACAVEQGGALKCWGQDRSGRLGLGRSVETPTRVDGLPTMMDRVVTSQDVTCALANAGDVYCWGRASMGQLGALLGAPTSGPVKVALPARARALSLGESVACAVLTDDSLWCWGQDMQGQLSPATIGVVTTPAEVKP